MTLADTEACAFFAAELLGHPVSPDNVRHWAHRHPDVLPRRGKRGRSALYALEDVEKLLSQRATLAPQVTAVTC